MKTVKIMIALVLLGIGADLKAQAKRASDVPTTEELSATTSDGRVVLLKSDGTWKYLEKGKTSLANDPALTKATNAKGSASLALEAALIFQSADVKPVARTEFVLLDASLTTILRDAGVEAPAQFVIESQTPDERLLSAYSLSLKYGFPEYVLFRSKATAALRSHTRGSVTTDFSGRATFQAVPVGTFYVVGYTTAGRSAAIWNLSVRVATGKNSVILDNKNTALLQPIAP